MRITIGIFNGDPPCGVNYYPSWKDFGKCVSVWRDEYAGPNKVGAGLSPKDSLKPKFRKYFVNSHCEWFIPYIERMADGEEVSTDEIIEGYRSNNHGRSPEILEG